MMNVFLSCREKERGVAIRLVPDSVDFVINALEGSFSLTVSQVLQIARYCKSMSPSNFVTLS